jgi:dipeptidyl aminopeptidase/acylaminoacyl peptidase
MRPAVLLFCAVAGCAEPPRTDTAGLIGRLADPDDLAAERMLVDGGPEVEVLFEKAYWHAPPDVALRMRAIERERENRRLGPVEFLADGAPTACDADGANRRAIERIERRDASRSPDGEWTAASVDVKGDLDIVLRRADGSERRVTHQKGADREPAFSPDGARLAIVTERDGDPEIYVVNLENLYVLRLTYSPGPDRSPRWSRDGSAVFFVSERDGRPQIYRVGRDRTRLMKVSDGGADDDFPR